MPKVELPIANGFYESDSLPISAQQCCNWYPNIVQTQALSQETLFGTPGLSQLQTSGSIAEINRGAHVKADIPYFVNGDTLFRLDRTVNPDLTETFTLAALGTIEGSGRVSMADNGVQLMVLVPGGKGYIYNEAAGTPFQEITDLDFTANGSPQQVKFLDGYFVVTTDSKKFIVSALNDGLSWNALDFGSAEADPDIIVAPAVTRNQLFITGSQTTEVFQNIGGTGFPFQRVNGFVMDKGCAAPFSIINANSTFYMIGSGENETPAIWAFTGNNYTKVSTTAIDNVLSSATAEELSAAFAWKYADRGASFVGFTVSDKTFVIDTINGRWHERSSMIDNSDRRWRVNSMVSAYNRVIVGDFIDGRIGELSKSIFKEYGGEIRRIVSTQPFSNVGDSMRVPSIELTMEGGVGNSDRSDPKVSMEISDDGGRTFTYERQRSIGKVGQYKKRAIWYKNGRFERFRVLRFKFSDPVKPVIIKLEAKIA